MPQHSYDTKVPEKLRQCQQWFASIITRPIDMESRMQPLSPTGMPMQMEATAFITPSPTLESHQRIELYNQQYWWRLLTILQDTFPLLTRLFGYYSFNESIAFPYLVKYPPDHWSLNHLGKYLTAWIESDYHAKDKSLVLNSARIDWPFNEGFVAGQYPVLDVKAFSQNFADLLDRPLFLQPHVYLFELPCNLFPFRQEMLKQDVDYWLNHDFPKLEQNKTFYTLLFRNQRNNMAWEPISKGEFYLLTLFYGGCTINDACEELEKQEKKIYQEALENLSKWFQKWAVYGLLSTSNKIIDPLPYEAVNKQCQS